MLSRLPAELDVEAVAMIRRHRQRLRRLQNFDGSWGGSSQLEKVVVTCQAVLALSLLGDTRDRRSIERGMRWLLHPKTGASEYSYWRIAPLVALRPQEPATSAEFLRIEQLVRDGLKHHPDSPLDSLLVECAYALGRSDDTFIQSTLSRLTFALQEDSAANWPASRLAYCFYICALAPGKLPKADIDRVVQLLSAKANITDTWAVWTNSVITSYVLMDLVLAMANDIGDYPPLEKLTSKAFSYLLSLGAKLHVPDPLPAGGEIKSEAYAHSLVLRAMLIFMLWKNKNLSQIKVVQFHSDDFLASQRRELTYLFIIVGLILFGFGITVPFVIPLVGSTFGDPAVWEVISRISSICGIIAFVMSGLYFLWSKYRPLAARIGD